MYNLKKRIRNVFAHHFYVYTTYYTFISPVARITQILASAFSPLEIPSLISHKSHHVPLSTTTATYSRITVDAGKKHDRANLE